MHLLATAASYLLLRSIAAPSKNQLPETPRVPPRNSSHLPGLPNAMCSIDGLEIYMRIPVLSWRDCWGGWEVTVIWIGAPQPNEDAPGFFSSQND